MVNTQYKIFVKNENNIILNITTKELYDNNYLSGFIYIKGKNESWAKILKIQKKLSVDQYFIKLSNFKTLTISDYTKILTNYGWKKPKDLLSNYIEIQNEENLNLKVISCKKTKGIGYSILVEDNKDILLNGCYVRFDEIERAQQD